MAYFGSAFLTTTIALLFHIMQELGFASGRDFLRMALFYRN
jgi:hypothetical protein